jgi:lipid-A-disaccharide synthase
VGLPNILAGDFVVPELLQDAATPEALAAEVLRWLEDARQGGARAQALHTSFTNMHHALQRDTSQLATDAIEKVLAHR